jgi:hypothetical protein
VGNAHAGLGGGPQSIRNHLWGRESPYDLPFTQNKLQGLYAIILHNNINQGLPFQLI